VRTAAKNIPQFESAGQTFHHALKVEEALAVAEGGGTGIGEGPSVLVYNRQVMLVLATAGLCASKLFAYWRERG
jgi:hypothetical protein